jgi:hypothetical protein
MMMIKIINRRVLWFREYMCQESSSMLERSCIAWQRYGDQREFLGEAGFESLTVLKMGAIGDKLAKVGLPPPLVKARGSYNVKNAMEKDLAATKAELAELKRTSRAQEIKIAVSYL